jgi:hypothetical protein
MRSSRAAAEWDRGVGPRSGEWVVLSPGPPDGENPQSGRIDGFRETDAAPRSPAQANVGSMPTFFLAGGHWPYLERAWPESRRQEVSGT